MGNNKKGRDGELFDMLRATGLRKKVARTVSKSTAQANGQSSDDFPAEIAQKTVRGLRMAASAIENRVPGKERNAASSSSRTKKRSAGSKRAQSGARRTAKRASRPTTTARKTGRPTAKTNKRQTATRNRRTRAR